MATNHDMVNIDAVNYTQKLVMLNDGTVCKMDGLFSIDDGVTIDEDDIEEADGATFQLPDGRWSYVLFMDFEAASIN